MAEVYAMFLTSEERKGSTGSATIVSFMDTDNNVLEISTSDKFWGMVGKYITEENPYCRVKYSVRKAGDKVKKADGTEVEIKRDTLNLEGCTRIPEKIWNSKVDNESAKQQKEDIELLAAVAPETLASYLRAIRAGV